MEKTKTSGSLGLRYYTLGLVSAHLEPLSGAAKELVECPPLPPPSVSWHSLALGVHDLQATRAGDLALCCKPRMEV